MKETIAGNLTRYRKAIDLSQEQLANLVSVTRQSINNYENAKTLPDSKTLSALARTLGVTLDDLLRPESRPVTPFRFRAHAGIDKQPQFATQVRRMLEIYQALEAAAGIPAYAPETHSCHQLPGNEALIQATAARFRRTLGLGETPILNLFAAVEELGLKVLRQPIATKGFFGLSACSFAQGAFVLINTHNISIEQQNFTLAQEIGHLIFHRDDYQDNLIKLENQGEEEAREAVANYFAQHLLVPQTEFERFYQISPNLIQLKQHFRVSYQVILKRLSDMGRIDYGREIAKIRKIYKQRNGLSLSNCIELPPTLKAEEFPENERYQQLIWQALNRGNISELKAAELLNITLEELGVRRREAEVYAIP
ncbi:XRE family transcriptional regulator [Laspinema olomoucense]|uniref:XRE family transcriptional regulator n=1 Tax=Laspinema olomoucense TaxID=3231600 RepID=UPI0021BA82A4|nr:MULTISPECIES: XRE family transcriptional regulator [unclassified Laspinema]MCT7974374.1 XRE family transcriptional regulator [Laspinema sp. D3d]MCT7990751.1 XRE family transcriptional regulator [Laspinema sp. D3a]